MKILILLLFVLAGSSTSASESTVNPLACDCPDCREKAASGDTGYTLPGLEGLNDDSNHHEEETDGHNHTEVDHAEEVDEHSDHDHADHPAHDSAEEAVEHDDHANHDHTQTGVVEMHDELTGAVGMRMYEAEGGILSRTSVFPAEIKLNRDRTAAVSPRYASLVRQVFAEIGDEVKKGDVLATLENRETLAIYTVAAPLDGVVITKDLAVGETADADKVLYEVADLSTVWADINVFPQYKHLIEKGMQVEFIAHDGHKASGAVKYISPIVSHETRTFTARCVLEEAGVDFTPGAFVRARIATETVDVAVRVEREAVQSIDGEAVVFVPGGQGYEPRAVETGLTDGHYVEIRKGLNPGDRYVADGAFTLKAELITSGLDPHAGHNH